MYLYAITAFFLVGVIIGLLMRLELIAPGKTIVEPQTYNGLFTVHGIIMIFMVVIPGLSATFGNFSLPIMIGARDVAFPRLNLFSFYLFLFGSFLAILSQFMRHGPPDTGGRFMLPIVLQRGPM
ncbi:MAG: cbb3-type cytochrome c oxidase subunit I [Bacteroidales bacterium]